MTRNALVTGAARGIGRSIAIRLARDGINVAVNDINANSDELNNVQKAIEEIGRKSIAIIADVSNEKEVEAMIKRVAFRFRSQIYSFSKLAIPLVPPSPIVTQIRCLSGPKCRLGFKEMFPILYYGLVSK